MFEYKTHGTCSTQIDLEIEDGVITACTDRSGYKRMRWLPRQYGGPGQDGGGPQGGRCEGAAARHSLPWRYQLSRSACPRNRRL